MRHLSLFSGIAALFAVAAACQACGPAATQTAPANTCPASAYHTTAPTAADLEKPTSCGAGGATCCVRVTKVATGTICCGQGKCHTVTLAPGQPCVTPAGCCIIKTAGGQTCCVPMCGMNVVVGKNGLVRVGTVSAPAPATKPTVEDSLSKLEALKARKDAIEAEIRKEQEALKALLKAQQERLNKVGMGPAVPVPPTPPAPPPSTPVPGPYNQLAPWQYPGYVPPAAPSTHSGPMPAVGPSAASSPR